MTRASVDQGGGDREGIKPVKKKMATMVRARETQRWGLHLTRRAVKKRDKTETRKSYSFNHTRPQNGKIPNEGGKKAEYRRRQVKRRKKGDSRAEGES